MKKKRFYFIQKGINRKKKEFGPEKSRWGNHFLILNNTNTITAKTPKTEIKSKLDGFFEPESRNILGIFFKLDVEGLDRTHLFCMSYI